MIPMIDLLVACIAFLLITAVWAKTGAIEARHDRARGTDAPGIEPEPAVEALRINVGADLISIARNGADQEQIPRGVEARARLERALQARRLAEPSTREVWISADSTVAFDDIARVMDVVNGVWNANGAHRTLAIRVL